MNSTLSRTPGGSSRRSFFLYLTIVPAGVFVILATLLIVQFKQFRALVSPATADVPEFVWSDSARARLDSVETDLRAFSSGNTTARLKTDSLWMSAEDVNLLLASSSIAVSHGIRVHVSIEDTLVILQTTQPVQALQGQLAWIFKKLASSGYLNARIEGYPQLKNGRLTFFPENGFLNGRKLPTTAWTKQGGLSLESFTDHHESYDALVRALAGIKATQGKILLVRNR